MAAVKNVTHRRSGTPEHYIWQSMRQRCTNPKNIGYVNYGGRGIAVCERWKRFDAFLEDMGNRPSPQHTLERVNNDLGYSKANCVWASKKAQSNNKRSNIRITLNGDCHTLKEWSVILGFTYEMAQQRIGKLGWDPVRAITEPRGPTVRLSRNAHH